MVIKRTEEVVEMPNGNRVHCYENHTTLDELKKAADEALGEYEKDPSLKNQLAAYGIPPMVAHFSWIPLLDDYSDGSVMQWMISQF